MVVVVVGAAAWYWIFHPHELSKYRPEQQGAAGVATVGWTEYASELIGPDDNVWHDSSINLVSVEPVIVDNSAHANVRVLMCIPATGSGEGVSGALSDFCRTAGPFHPGVVNLDRRQLVLMITFARPGRLDIAGVQVNYRDGVRRGNQHSWIEWRWTVNR